MEKISHHKPTRAQQLSSSITRISSHTNSVKHGKQMENNTFGAGLMSRITFQNHLLFFFLNLPHEKTTTLSQLQTLL